MRNYGSRRVSNAQYLGGNLFYAQEFSTDGPFLFTEQIKRIH